MAYLLDTDVISELRRPAPNRGVLEWFERIPASRLFLSVLVLGEIVQGIERLRARDRARAEALDVWLATLRRTYSDHVVGVDEAVATEWGRLNAAARVPVVDGLMAATALVHGWTLVTRNGSDVAPTGVTVLDPFEAPDDPRPPG